MAPPVSLQGGDIAPAAEAGPWTGEQVMKLGFPSLDGSFGREVCFYNYIYVCVFIFKCLCIYTPIHVTWLFEPRRLFRTGGVYKYICIYLFI